MADSQLLKRFDSIHERIDKALTRSGRSLGDVQLVAVSKWHSAEQVAALARHWGITGMPVFGESYVQEAVSKMDEVSTLLGTSSGDCEEKISWHFVGHIQSRKAKEVAGLFSLIHSVDSIKLAKQLHKSWEAIVVPAGHDAPAVFRKSQDILLQVNIGREEQKSGVLPEHLAELCTEIMQMPGLAIQGLMCLPPVAEHAEETRPYFQELHALRDRLSQETGLALPHLSMGMSSDFEVAIEEGATLVRIGTDIFGPRDYA